jgi:major inositol transporter-like SP family MFS transporter
LGRRKTIAFLSVTFIWSSLGSAFAPSLQAMIPFRFALGVAVGGASSIVPVFFAELAPVERRGQMVFSIFFFIFNIFICDFFSKIK